MKILGLDFETTGLEPKADRVLEVGLVLWDAEKKKPEALDTFLVIQTATISEEITQLTGITSEKIYKHGITPLQAFTKINNLAVHADYICGHNGRNFDKLFLEEEFKRIGIPPLRHHWLDTLEDLPNMEKFTSKKLDHLACEHGFLNPFPHSALSDVLTMFKILEKYDIQEVIKYSLEESILVRAVVSYDDRELAKKRGFRWEPEKKIWVKKIKVSKLEDEKKAQPVLTLSVLT